MNPSEASVRLAQVTIAAAKQARQEAVDAADRVYWAATQASHQQLRELLERYEEPAFDLACESNRPPRTRSGGFQRPDDVEVREEGIHMCWHDDHDFRSYTATWDELTA